MTTVDLSAAWVPILLEPGDAVLIPVTLPVGYDSGTWTSNVYTSRRQAGSLEAFTLTGPSSRVLTLALSSAQVAALAAPGTSRFTGYWELVRTVSGSVRTWLKGDFVIDAAYHNSGNGGQAVTVTLNEGAVAVEVGPITMTEVTATLRSSAAKVTYMTTAVSGVPSDGWYFHGPVAADLTGRVTAVIWEGTPAQIPAQGVTDASVQVGDLVVTRATSL